MRPAPVLLLAGALLAAAPLHAAPVAAAVLPAAEATPGWTLAEPPREFAGPDLFELIDGGAELYQEFGFQRAVAAQYQGPAAATLQIEVYEMTTAEAAFGVFSIMQPHAGTAVAAGQAAMLADGYLLLWQGRHFVSIVANGRGADTERDLRAIAGAIAPRLGPPGERPALLAQLPPAGLQAAKYFRGPVALSNLHAFGSNVFGVREGVFGAYAGFRLFVFRYATAAEAAARLQAAAAVLARDPLYRKFAATAAGFECVDSEGHRLSATVDGRCLRLHVTAPATPAATAPALQP